jgi:hypothetical protein
MTRGDVTITFSSDMAYSVRGKKYFFFGPYVWSYPKYDRTIYYNGKVEH